MGAFALKGRGALVGATDLVPEGEVLPVVVVEVQVVVGVVRRAVDDVPQEARDAVVAIVNGDGPDVDEDVEAQVGDFVQGEEEGVDMVGQALHEAIDGVESMAGKRRRNLPEVVGLVEALWGEVHCQWSRMMVTVPSFSGFPARDNSLPRGCHHSKERKEMYTLMGFWLPLHCGLR